MPFLFDTNYQFKEDQYQIDAKEIIKKFPFLIERIVYGEILATFIDGKVAKYKLPFKCEIIKPDSNNAIAKILDPNPLKKKGIPPCSILVSILKYEEKINEEIQELPIAEGLLLKKSYFPPCFEEIVKRLLREEEARLIIESTIFHQNLKNQVVLLREAYISFEEEVYPNVKTSCRKILENLREKKISGWEKIDNSKNLFGKFKSILNSVYSFASIGGAHEGIATKEDAGLIIKITGAILFYVNTLLKNKRITFKNEGK